MSDWRRWSVVHGLASWAYRLGVIAGDGVRGTVTGWRLDSVRWRGRRVYLLGWPTMKWECLLLRHHWPYWPEDRPVFMGLCGRCLPWPCCGSIEHDHVSGCSAESEHEE